MIGNHELIINELNKNTLIAGNYILFKQGLYNHFCMFLIKMKCKAFLKIK